MRVSTRRQARNMDPLARVTMRESERRAAREYMEQGERVAEFVVAAMAAIRAAGHAFERSLRALVGTKSAS